MATNCDSELIKELVEMGLLEHFRHMYLASDFIKKSQCYERFFCEVNSSHTLNSD